jgi:uncharacterized protein
MDTGRPASNASSIGPVAPRARIEILDVLRGIAILGIFYINVPYMAASVWTFSADVRLIGWSAADRNAWVAVNLLLAGTQRCMLEFLFGAGMMLLARKAMVPDGPVAVADLYYRRNLWLLGFGLVDVFLLLWPGDILHIYALAALLLFPFRLLKPRTLVVLGLGWAVLTGIGIPEYGAREFVARTELVQRVEAGDPAARAEWQKLATHRPDPVLVAREAQAHRGGWLPYAEEAWRYWSYLAQNWLVWDVLEAFCTMLIGVALWKWGVIQGQRSARFYLALLAAGYGFGFAARALGMAETLSFSPAPRTLWITGEFARLAIGLGHVALVNLLVKSRMGAAALGVFKAPGRMAFSLYFLQQIAGMYLIFAPWGLNLWGRLGWAEMAAVSTGGVVLLVVLANLWMRTFASGPLEWAWRSLAYARLQPLLNAQPQPDRSPPCRPASSGTPPAAR